jgi:hypothetical protein
MICPLLRAVKCPRDCGDTRDRAAVDPAHPRRVPEQHGPRLRRGQLRDLPAESLHPVVPVAAAVKRSVGQGTGGNEVLPPLQPFRHSVAASAFLAARQRLHQVVPSKCSMSYCQELWIGLA